MSGELLTGYLLGGIGERHRQGMRQAARTAAGIVSDQGLVAQIQQLQAQLAAERASAQANRDSAISWRAYAAQLEERIEAMMRAQGLIA